MKSPEHYDLQQALTLWELRDLEPIPHPSCNYVAFARHRDNDVVVKIGKDLEGEMAALRLYNGQGAVRLLKETDTMFLMERAKPGHMLSSLKEDEQATAIAIEIMRSLWKPVPNERAPFTQLSDWFKGFEALRAHFGGTTGPLDCKLVERAESASTDLLKENFAPMLIHGDLHHFNILSSERGWIAIDPKGVIGPSAYEVGPFLLNPNDKPSEELARLIDRRIAILTEGLEIERERICEWAIAHAVLSAWWGIEDHTGWERAMTCAAIIAQQELR